IVRSAIDLGRFDVLTALHYPLPPTLEAERRVWDGLARLAKLEESGPDRAFAHAAGGGAKT
ncbi:MAG TPA: hypothetical protein VE650_05415, partial [Acetobacteraceae bacterium]|nr:hypothetical protein [Acetobacteraceae bacterium]